jgi:hypothetical protein
MTADWLDAEEREYKVFRAAHEGDPGPLIALLESGAELTEERRRLVIKVLRGEISHPPHRQKRITTIIRAREIAAYVRSLGGKQLAAIAAAEERFDCSEGTVKNALKLERRIEELTAKLERAGTFLAQAGEREALFGVLEDTFRKMDEENLRLGLRKLWRRPRVWEI